MVETAWAAPVPVKLACIGNSITAGGYPAKLATRLGAGFQVQNSGVSGTTLLKRGDKPYWTQGKLGEVFTFKPDIITIKLGTNDSKSQNWAFKADYAKDLAALVDTLRTISSKPQIWLCLPSPSFSTGSGINGNIIKNEIIPLIRQVASDKKTELIDIQTPLTPYPALFPDQVHPNDAGSDSIAAIIYRNLAAKAVRIASIGNSITQYVGTVEGTTVASEAYAIRLGMRFGRTHMTRNYGVSGAYAQKVSPFPYWNTGKIAEVLAWKPTVVTIKLGTNDSRVQNWNRANYIRDLTALVDTLNTLNPKPKIWLVQPVPAWKRNGIDPFNGISGVQIKDQVIPAMKEVAEARKLSMVDAHTPFLSLERLVPDGVHPIAEGQDSLAAIIHRAMLAEVPSGIGAQPVMAAASREGGFRGMLRKGGRVLLKVPGISGLLGVDGRATRP